MQKGEGIGGGSGSRRALVWVMGYSNHSKQNTVQSTGITREERQLWGQGGERQRGQGGDRTSCYSDEMVSLAHPIYAGIFIMYVALNK